MNGKAATEDFRRRESQTEITEALAEAAVTYREATEFDAVHPRFQKPKKPEVIEEFQRANDYYCEQCHLYFAPTVLGLKTHFKEDMVQHRPIDKCFYCDGPVYAYSFNKERQIYHNCEDSKKS